jgi:TonB-linked SusC/RagA family outer membrane protein
MYRLMRTGALVALLLAALPAAAQVTVEGVVTDESGLPLPGVNVAVDGTSEGAVTNLDGFYELTTSTPAPFDLLFRFVGYRTERRTVAQASGTVEVDVQMGPDVLGLDDVVVTGTGVVEERRRLGTAVSVVDAQPLYIVDGVIVDNSSNELVGVGNGGVQNRLVDLNPNDIERIEVIKGAAAAAVYGSRAANGVVQIFTKRGQSGAPRITYEARLSASEVRETYDFTDVPFEWASTDVSDDTRVAVERFDYQDDIFETALGQEHYVSVSGGTQGTSYFLSGSFLDNEGIIRNSDFERGTLRLNLGQQLTDWAFARVTAGVTRSRSSDVPSGGQGFLDGALTSLQFLPNTQSAQPDDTGDYPDLGLSGNPLEIVETYQFSQEVTRATSSVNLTLTPLQGLTASLIGGVDTYSQEARGLRPPGNASANSDGLAEYGDQNRTLVNLDATLVYDTNLGSDITSTTTLGGTYQYEEASSVTASANQLVLGIETLAGGTPIFGGNGRFQSALAGGFLQETLGFYDRIFLTAAGRFDASSRFGEDDRVQFYPKVSTSFNVIDDPSNNAVSFFKLRASYGQAGNLTGIGAYERFTNYFPTSFNGRTALIPSTALGNEFIKPERQTEIEVGTDLSLLAGRLGVEFTFYNQTIDDLLLQRQLAPSIGSQTRIENVGELTNRGVELALRGALVQRRDFNLDATILFSANRNEVTRLNDGNGDGIGDAFAIGDGNFGAQWAIEGEPLGVFYWFAAARNEDGSLLLDANGLPQRERGTQDINDPSTITPQRDPVTGQPTGSNLRILTGDPNPDWNGSFITDLRYRDLEFRMQWDAVQGFDVFNWNARNGDRFGRGNTVDFGRELEEGSTIPKGTADAYGRLLLTDKYVEDGSFVKLRELSLAYTIRPDVIGLQSVRLRLAGRNLFSFDDYSGYDPEVSIAGRSTGVSGFDFGAVPIPRQYSFGATFTF